MEETNCLAIYNESRDASTLDHMQCTVRSLSPRVCYAYFICSHVISHDIRQSATPIVVQERPVSDGTGFQQKRFPIPGKSVIKPAGR